MGVRAAFIGLGVMGFPMAGHLVKAGFDVTVYDVRPEQVAIFVERNGGTDDLVLVGVLGRLAAHLAPSSAAVWAAAAATMWALLVIPVEVHYWGITIARDLPAHLLALAAVLSARAGSPLTPPTPSRKSRCSRCRTRQAMLWSAHDVSPLAPNPPTTFRSEL